MTEPVESGGRRRRRPASGDNAHAIFDRTGAYRHLRNPFTPLKVFSDDQVAAIHDAALGMLETQGMKVLSEDARVLYRQAGATVDEASNIVRIDRGLVTKSLASAPRDITLHSVDPQRHVPLYDGHVAFAPTSGPPKRSNSSTRRSG